MFQLDVDNDIWQDVGLEDDSFAHNPPRWLSDENTRTGIRALLERDRCLEEEKRVMHERCAMQEWYMEEWACTKLAKQAAGELHSVYYLGRHI